MSYTSRRPCIQRIRGFKESGTTMLFVSHDPAAVKTLCDRALLLDQGLLIREGPAEAILDYYNAMIAQREKEAEMDALRGEKREIGFGSQIRSYTLHPSQRIKDHRTKVEVGNTEAVLDGDLDAFIRAMLLHEAARTEKSE